MKKLNKKYLTIILLIVLFTLIIILLFSSNIFEKKDNFISDSVGTENIDKDDIFLDKTEINTNLLNEEDE